MRKRLQKYLFIVIALFAMTIQTREAKASHAMGADLTYECLGGNTYRIRVSFYRDCIGISAPQNVFVSIQSVSCGQSLGITCTRIPGTGQEVTPLCVSAVSTCNGGVYTGIQEWVYEGVITLPMQCPDWVFSYNLCCRNAAINTITNPASSTFYIYATLNNTISPCNSSPTFSNKPVPFACIGQEYCFNHGAFDPDGDSLVYSLITPKQNATATVNYIPPFSATSPLTSLPAVTFNTSNGDICMTPQNLEVTVMAVLVQEYRNGVLIGSVERDIQITVLNCNNTLPTLSGMNGTNNFNATICAGQPFCFTVNSADPDPLQTVTVTWDSSITGATFTTSGGAQPVGTFCWTPGTNDISSNPYCFTIMVRDNACPMNGSQIYSFCITVNGLDVDAGPDQLIACNGLATLNASVTGGSGTYTYLWSNGATTASQNTGVGTYIVTVSDGLCSAQDTISVINAYVPTAAFTSNGICPNSSINFTNQSTTPGGTITSWNWNFGDGGTSTLQNPSHIFTASGTYNVTLIIGTSFGCFDTVVQPLTIVTSPNASFTGGPACVGSSVTFTNTTTPAGTYTWQWNFGNGLTSNAQNPTTVYTTPGTYNVSLIATNSIGCTDTAIQPVVINPLPVPAFTVSTITCQGSPVIFTNTSVPGGGTMSSYLWNFGNGSTSTGLNPVVNYTAAGNYNVTLTATNSFGCSATITQNIGIDARPVVDAGPNQSICIGGSAILTVSGGNTYIWSPGGQTTASITVTPSVTTTYTVTATDLNGCTASDNITVSVNSLPTVTVTPSQSICDGQSANLTASGGISFSWSPSGNTTASIVVSPTVSTTYAVTATNVNGCSNTAYTTVTVNPLPVVSLSNVFLCQGVTSTLNAGNPGMTYLWSTGQTSQIINVTNPGSYTVTVTNGYGCTASASALASSGGTIVNALQNSSFCTGGSVVLNAGNPGHTYLWSTGSTSQTITVTSAGPYSVTITNQNGCTGTLSTTVNENPVPTANFLPTTTCISDPVQFTDISTVPGGTVTGWSWNFGDGNISQQQNPLHTFNAPGTYNVTLVVTSDLGCTDTIIRVFTVYPLPNSNFSYNFGCENEPIQFVDQSFVNSGNIIGWFWDFGDGTTSTLQNPWHSFTTAGMQVVTLTVTTAGGCSDSQPHNIHIYPLPDLSFSTGTTGSCLGSTVTVTNTSTSSNGAINTWFWDFGDGTTSSDANPTHTYTLPGTYNISLIAQTSHGCSDTLTNTFTIYPLPPADAGANQNICFGSSATLTASGGVSYLWNTGSTSQTIIVSPTIHTSYYVTVTDSNGCVNSDSVRIYVRALPLANAGPDKSICIGSSVTLTGSGAVNLLWSTGATTATITVSPVTTTQYILQATYANGCSKTDTVIVTVNPLPVVSAGPDQMICEGSTATLTASGGLAYSWAPTGETTQTIYVNPLLPQVYSVTAIDINGCNNSDTVSVGINPLPYANISPAFICIGNTTTLNAGNPGSTYLWSPGGETTQTLVVSDSGYYEVQITNAFGCVGVAGTFVTVGGTGLVLSPSIVNICNGQTTVLNANNPGSTYIWSTGATTQTIVEGTMGIYTVTVTDPTGCSASFPFNLIVNPLPQVQFTTAPVCLGETVQFNNQTSISSGTIISWNWNFGDGSYSSSQQVSHNYLVAGAYSVTLQATSGMGCTASVTQSVAIDPRPVAGFNATPVCNGNPVNFTDASVIASGTINGWSWNFGDGNISSQQNPAHTYSAPGLYTITLIVTSASGCTDTVSRQLEIYDVPVVSFTSIDVCDGSPVTFTNSSYILDGFITSYLWNFGDGTTSVLTDPSHLYTIPGIYSVTLTATSNLGCTGTITQSVQVNSVPVASGTATPVCDGVAVQFTNSSVISNGTITSVYWNFGDGSSSNANSPNHIYASSGNYNATLVVSSASGCADSVLVPVTVHPNPVAAFTVPGNCLSSTSQFTDQSSVQPGSVTGWFWNFGDGTSSVFQNPAHNYSLPGSYTVMLIATSNNGCSDSVSNTINVYPVPVAVFATTNVCQGTAASFYNQSVLQGGGTLACSWNFGDGNTSSALNPQHTYGMPGIYTVSLTVTSSNGCTDIVSGTVQIYNAPTANFTALNTCELSPVNFTDLSTSIDGNISNWNWSFGDGSTSISANPFHQYGAPGTYPVTLTVTSIYGCADTASAPVSVYALPAPMITAVSNCDDDPVSFNNVTAAGDTTTYSYLWNFGDGMSSVTANPVHLYPAAGTYVVSLQMTSPNGCVAIASTTVNVSPSPDANFDVTNACAGTNVQFTNLSTISSGTIVSYIWNFGDGSPSTGVFNPTHTYANAGTYGVTLVAISDNGCEDTLSQSVVIYPVPVPNFIYDNASGCGPVPVNFTDASFVGSGSIVSWNWNFGNGETSMYQNASTVYASGGTYTVTLTVTSDMGCSETFVQPDIITVFPSPFAGFIAEPYQASIVNPVIHFNNISTGAISYLWYFGDGTISQAISPTHTFPDTGTYNVTLIVQNSFGCIDTFIQMIYIIPEFSLYVPNAFTPNDDGTNDIFTVVGMGITELTLKIYNRWGENVYTSTSINQGWNGLVQKDNSIAQQDVYVYDLIAKDAIGRTHSKVGRVTLIR